MFFKFFQRELKMKALLSEMEYDTCKFISNVISSGLHNRNPLIRQSGLPARTDVSDSSYYTLVGSPKTNYTVFLSSMPEIIMNEQN